MIPNDAVIDTIFERGASEGMSEFDRELESAKSYFGEDFPGDEGLTCQKCGAAVNLGWAHITWHEALGVSQ